MPRIARIAPAGIIQHVLNRGNGRMKLFHKPADYAAFVNLMADAAERMPDMRLLGYCLMPNHWHLVLWPRKDGSLSAYMRWLSNTHVRRWHQHWHTVGQSKKGDTHQYLQFKQSFVNCPRMPRIARIAPAGIIQHVLNRGNGRMKLFHKPADYAAFVNLMADAAERMPDMRLLGYCLMPNHWHLVLWPRKDGSLSAYMRWLSNTHVRRWHQHWHTVGHGHVYQGRFKSFPVQDDSHLLTLLKYVESNPLRAALVKRAENWQWSSLSGKTSPDGRSLLTPWPLDAPGNWVAKVNECLGDGDLSAVRESVVRGRPLGGHEWVRKIANRFDLGFTLRPRGRPRKKEKS